MACVLGAKGYEVMIVYLPRKMMVDIDDIPNDFEEQVQKCFAEYTEMTNPAYMYHDKLAFIDRMVELLHGGKDADDAVMDLMKGYLEHEVGEYGNIPSEEDYLSIEFMETCYSQGERDRRLYSKEWFPKQRKHDDDKVMKLLCRAIKAVMEYEWGSDGISNAEREREVKGRTEV